MCAALRFHAGSYLLCTPLVTPTALVLAFLQVAQLIPVVEIATRRSAASEHFGDLTTPGGWDFDDTFIKFLSMLMPGTLNTRTKWWVKVSVGVGTCALPAMGFAAKRLAASACIRRKLRLTHAHAHTRRACGGSY
jgi:hypothetical protein